MKQTTMLTLPWEQAKARPAAPVTGPLFAPTRPCACKEQMFPTEADGVQVGGTFHAACFCEPRKPTPGRAR